MSNCFCEAMIKDVRRKIRAKLKYYDYTQQDLARWLGLSAGAVSVRLNTGKFSLMELQIIFRKLKFSRDEIYEVFNGIL